MNRPAYQALLWISFGAPEKPDDIMPFLENVTRGRNVSRTRLEEVAKHYEVFGGKSPLNEQNRKLIRLLAEDFKQNNIDLPIYFGNRNWHPFIVDALREMQARGVTKALAFVTSSMSSYSGCRQYLEDIEQARKELGNTAPHIDKIRVFYNHPLFIEAISANLKETQSKIPESRREKTHYVFTAHSIPISMAQSCDYEKQFREAASLVAAVLRLPSWSLAYQSRSGSPQLAWLEPDILERLKVLSQEGIRDVMVIPLGFVSDHMEILYDLDHQAKALAGDLGLGFYRANTAGSHPKFIEMVRTLVLERLQSGNIPAALGSLGPGHDFCLPDCCPIK